MFPSDAGSEPNQLAAGALILSAHVLDKEPGAALHHLVASVSQLGERISEGEPLGLVGIDLHQAVPLTVQVDGHDVEVLPGAGLDVVDQRLALDLLGAVHLVLSVERGVVGGDDGPGLTAVSLHLDGVLTLGEQAPNVGGGNGTLDLVGLTVLLSGTDGGEEVALAGGLGGVLVGDNGVDGLHKNPSFLPS